MSENGDGNRPFIDRRQLAPHGALQKIARTIRPRRDGASGLTKSGSGTVERHPPKSPPKRALYRWGAYEGGAATRRLRRGSYGRSLGDRPEKQPHPQVLSVLPHGMER